MNNQHIIPSSYVQKSKKVHGFVRVFFYNGFLFFSQFYLDLFPFPEKPAS